MNYYNRHIGDYAKKAGHLSPLEHGVYTLLLDRYYDREQGPTRDEALRWTRAKSADELAAVAAVLAEFFTLTDGRYLQSRVEDEFAKWAEYQQKQSDKGKKGGRPRKAAVKLQVNSSFSEESQTKAEKSQSTNPLIQLPIEAKAKTAPSGVDFGEVAPQVVADFTAHRKAQRAPITQTALDAIRREAGKAGLTLEAALAMCCARGWRGFKADWAGEQQARAGPAQAPGKTMQALKTLEDMKNGLANTRNSDRIPEAALLEFGSDASR